MLLAIGCGLVILLAGGIQELRVTGQEQTATLLKTGQPGTAGDVTVQLITSSVDASNLVANVRIGGIDDADGLDGFTLVGPGKVVAVTSSTCSRITVDERDCALAFATTEMQGTSRQLIFHRADDQLRWVLAQGP